MLMGVMLLKFNISNTDTIKTYVVSTRILAVNYLVLSLLVFCMLYFGLRNSPDDIFPFPVLLISLSQGLIMAYALLSLYVPTTFVWKNIKIFNVLPLSVGVALYTLSALLFGDPECSSFPDFLSKLTHPTIFLRFVLLLFNIYQIVFYNVLLQKCARRYLKHLHQYYSDTVQLKPQWAKKNFYLAALFGCLSIASSLFKDINIDTLFTALFGIYYFIFAIMYMDYKHIFVHLEPEFIAGLSSHTNGLSKDSLSVVKSFDWQMARAVILSEGLYLRQGITVLNLAEYFHTNRTTFSAALNKYERKNFNTFINQQRIEYAKKILAEKPELPLSEVAQLCGYSEHSNFARQFKLVCNLSPVEWSRLYCNGLPVV
jgi:AraC-like DNA-binding protein